MNNTLDRENELVETQASVMVEPYLLFWGRCEEALRFYERAIGAEISALLRFKDSPEPNSTKVPGDKVMHACMRVGSTTVMASDGCGAGPANFQGFALSLAVPDEETCDRFFAALANGGKVQMPLGKTFFSPRFGMVTDRFGILWMIIVAQQ